LIRRGTHRGGRSRLQIPTWRGLLPVNRVGLVHDPAIKWINVSAEAVGSDGFRVTHGRAAQECGGEELNLTVAGRCEGSDCWGDSSCGSN
jgi:hypothetical protein